MPSPIDPSGDLDNTSDEGLLALAHAWERRAAALGRFVEPDPDGADMAGLGSGRESRSADDSSINGGPGAENTTTVMQSYLASARTCHELAYRRGLTGARWELIDFLARRDFVAEAIAVCEEGIADGHTDYLLKAAEIVGGERAVGYLERARAAGCHADHLLADCLARNSWWHPDAQLRGKIWKLLDDAVIASEQAITDAPGASPSASDDERRALDDLVNSYIDTIDVARQTVEQLGDDSMVDRFQHRLVRALTGPPLGKFEFFDNTGKSIPMTELRRNVVSEWTDTLLSRAAGNDLEKRNAVVDQLLADINRPGEERDGLAYGLTFIYGQQAADDGASRPEALTATDNCLKWAEHLSRRGVPGGDRQLLTQLTLAASTHSGPASERYAARLLSTAIEMAESGEPDALIKAAELLEQHSGRDAHTLDFARQAWTEAVSRGIEPRRSATSQAVVEIIQMVGHEADEESVLERCDEIVRDLSDSFPGVGAELYSNIVESEQLSQSPALLLKILERQANAGLDNAERNGDVMGLAICDSALAALPRQAGGGSAHRQIVDRLDRSAIEIAQQHPHLAGDLSSLLEHAMRTVQRRDIDVGYQTTGAGAEIRSQRLRVVSLGNLMDWVVEKAYEVAPHDPRVVRKMMIIAIERGEDSKALEFAERLDKSTGESPVRHKLSDSIDRLRLNAARALGDVDVLDAIHARLAKLPDGGVDVASKRSAYMTSDAVTAWGDDLMQRDLPVPFTRFDKTKQGELLAMRAPAEIGVRDSQHDRSGPTRRMARRRSALLDLTSSADRPTEEHGSAAPSLLASPGGETAVETCSTDDAKTTEPAQLDDVRDQSRQDDADPGLPSL